MDGGDRQSSSKWKDNRRPARQRPHGSGLARNLLDQHAAALELYARQWCDTPRTSFRRRFEARRSAQLPDNPAAWLFRVVRNGAIDAGQAARRRKRHETAAAAGCSVVRGRAGDRPGASTRRGGRRASEPADRRARGHHRPLWGGLTFEQSAGVAGCSSSTAHRLYARGL